MKQAFYNKYINIMHRGTTNCVAERFDKNGGCPLGSYATTNNMQILALNIKVSKFKKKMFAEHDCLSTVVSYKV